MQASFGYPRIGPWATLPRMQTPRQTPLCPPSGRLPAIDLFHLPVPFISTPAQTPLPATPYTPAPCFFAGAPPVFEAGTFPAQPLGADIPVRLHHHIIFNPIDLSVPVLQWDIIQPAELARVVGGRGLLGFLNLKAPATTPGCKRMYITSDTPYLEFWMRRWGPVIIERDDNIKIVDVLDAIHHYFLQPLTDDDIDELEDASPHNMGTVRLASNYRMRESYETLPGVTAQLGLKRSDALGGLRRFQGLRAVVFDDGTWKVYLALATGPVPDISSYCKPRRNFVLFELLTYCPVHGHSPITARLNIYEGQIQRSGLSPGYCSIRDIVGIVSIQCAR
ncbi:hypothetical protein DFP72DRAFT_1163941 [Ephemerocybe angulata]|uniref:DUF6699 domain-containing protein n=1 Tax=Ephemerocybe angulata TaxID=980116 RepID=A0A8H6MCD9_9AGAR|nr:hypothetical protein DFP72DRAFT_1163941 [Tulosesus angulatus]